MSNYQYPPGFNANLNQSQQSGEMGYSPHGQMGYPPQTQVGYPPQGQTGFAPQGQMGYPPQGQAGYPPARSNGAASTRVKRALHLKGQAEYQPASQIGQPQQGQKGYPVQEFVGNTTQGPNGYAPQDQMGHFQPKNSYYTGLQTVSPASDFNSSADSQMLYKVMKGLGRILRSIKHCGWLNGSDLENSKCCLQTRNL
ncbi:hypothetical protein Aperf_G00000090437 [Anoplocephala perfoliata]